MSGHTPGPWTAEEDAGRAQAEGKDDFFPWLIEAPLCTVAGVSGIGGAEADANARLIAAAPDLLVGIRVARDLLVASGFAGSEVVRQIGAAIAKAEGR